MHPFLDKGLTSDHAYQSICIFSKNVDAKPPADGETISQDKRIDVATWNLQDLCTASSEKRRFSNNPFNYTENLWGYRERKELQIEKILSYLGSDDIIFLQEIDFLFCNAGSFYVVNPELNMMQQELTARLLQGVAEKNFGIIISPHNFIRGCGTQKLVTLFDKSKFTLLDSDPVFLTEMGGGYFMHRGLEARLQEIETGHVLIATNVHLKYGESPVDAILAYQSMHSEHLCIIGGDTNHVDEQMLALASGGYNYATNFSCDVNGYLTTIHEGIEMGPGLKKSYDRFFVTPSTDTPIKCVINEDRSEMVGLVRNYPMMNTLVRQRYLSALNLVQTQGLFSTTMAVPFFYSPPPPKKVVLPEELKQEKEARIASIFKRAESSLPPEAEQSAQTAEAAVEISKPAM